MGVTEENVQHSWDNPAVLSWAAHEFWNRNSFGVFHFVFFCSFDLEWGMLLTLSKQKSFFFFFFKLPLPDIRLHSGLSTEVLWLIVRLITRLPFPHLRSGGGSNYIFLYRCVAFPPSLPPPPTTTPTWQFREVSWTSLSAVIQLQGKSI